MTRTAAWRIGLAALVLLLAGWLWFGRPPQVIDRTAAETKAAAMLAAYAAHTGEPAAHFVAPSAVDYPDGWEFSWRYGPCPDVAALRIFIHRDGKGDYGAPPDCQPARGLAARPEIV